MSGSTRVNRVTLTIFEAHRGEGPTPHAAGIKCKTIWRTTLTHYCGPVSKQDFGTGVVRLQVLEPGCKTVGCNVGFVLKFKGSVSFAVAQTCEVVGNQAESIHTLKPVVP